MEKAPVLIGTSGFSHAGWKELFYPKGMKPPERLSFYAKHFPAVESSVTFYRAIADKTITQWKESVPASFRFSLLARKSITHYWRLRHCRRELVAMWRNFQPFGEQLACVVFMLPSSLKPDYALLADFLQMATHTRDEHGLTCRFAFEFRSRRWYEEEYFKLLAEYGATAVLHDMPYKGGFWPIIAKDDELVLKSGKLLMLPEDWVASTSAHFCYLRLHGTVGKQPWQEYGAQGLELWERVFEKMLNTRKPVFAFFNNDPGAAAIRDARLLQEAANAYEPPLPTSEPVARTQKLQDVIAELKRRDAEEWDAQPSKGRRCISRTVS